MILVIPNQLSLTFDVEKGEQFSVDRVIWHSQSVKAGHAITYSVADNGGAYGSTYELFRGPRET